MTFKYEHEGLAQSLLNDRPEELAIEIDTSLTSGIFVAKMSRCRTTQRMAEDSKVLQIQSPGKSAGRVGGVQVGKLIDHKSDIGAPHAHRRVANGTFSDSGNSSRLYLDGRETTRPSGKTTTAVRYGASGPTTM